MDIKHIWNITDNDTVIVGLGRFVAFYKLFPYISPYIIFLSIVIVLLITRVYLIKKDYIDYILVIFISFFAGLKRPFTYDLIGYKWMFENYENLSLINTEPIFLLIAKIVHLFTDNYIFFFLIYEILTIILIYLSIKKIFKEPNNSYILSWLTFISFPFLFLNSFGVLLRQVLAMALFIYAILNWFDGGKKKSFLFFILSMLSHYSAVFAFFILCFTYILYHKVDFIRKNIRYILIFLIIFSILFSTYFVKLLLIINYIPLIGNIFGKYLIYFQAKEVTPVVKLLTFNFFGLLAIILINYEGKENRNILFRYYCMLFVVGVVLLNSTFAYGPISRMSFYYLVFIIILIPYISMCFYKYIQNVNFFIYTLLLITFLYGLFYIDPSNGNYSFLPCQSLFCEFFYNIFD